MYQTHHDVSITGWQASGLLAPSVVRLHKLATLEKGLIRRRLGHLQAADRQRISALMQQVYGTW
jgi:mRNA interferase MazF